MAVKIRLSRGGSKKRPFYKMVVAEATSPRDGRFIEKVGTYNPMLPADKERVTLVEDRIKYWLSVGAQPTDRVAKFLGAAKIIAMPEVRESPQKSQPKEKAKLRLAEKDQKAADAITAAQEAKEAAKAAKEQPKEEVAEVAEEVTAEKAPQPEDVTVEIGDDAPEKGEEVELPAQPVEPEQPEETVEVDVAVEGAEDAHEVTTPEPAESEEASEKPAE